MAFQNFQKQSEWHTAGIELCNYSQSIYEHACISAVNDMANVAHSVNYLDIHIYRDVHTYTVTFFHSSVNDCATRLLWISVKMDIESSLTDARSMVFKDPAH